MRESGVTGVRLAVIDRGRVVGKHAFGYRRLSSGRCRKRSSAIPLRRGSGKAMCLRSQIDVLVTHALRDASDTGEAFTENREYGVVTLKRGVVPLRQHAFQLG